MVNIKHRSAQAQIAKWLAASRGTLKVELLSQGLLRATIIENFRLLLILNSTLQLCFVGPMLPGSTLMNLLVTPVGVLQTYVNTETSQVMLGACGSHGELFLVTLPYHALLQ